MSGSVKIEETVISRKKCVLHGTILQEIFHGRFDHFSVFYINISRVTSKVQFRGYKLSQQYITYNEIATISYLLVENVTSDACFGR